MGNNPLLGARYLLRGASMLTTPGVRAFVLVPLLINVLLFGGAIWLLMAQFGEWVDYWLSLVPAWLGFLDWLLWPLFALLVLLLVYFCFGIVAGVVAAPFNGLLAERVELHLRGVRNDEGGWRDLLALAPRALAREMAKLAYYLPRLLGLFLFTLIPGMQLFAPFLWFMFGAWLLAIQYCDYPMDNNRVSFQQMRVLLASKRFTSFGFGALASLWLLVPLLNLLLMPAAVVGATLFWVDNFAAAERSLDPLE